MHLFQFKKQLQKFKLDKNLIKKDNVNNSVKHKETINIICDLRTKIKDALEMFSTRVGKNKVQFIFL